VLVSRSHSDSLTLSEAITNNIRLILSGIEITNYYIYEKIFVTLWGIVFKGRFVKGAPK
jgi:hypothetical protein